MIFTIKKYCFSNRIFCCCSFYVEIRQFISVHFWTMEHSHEVFFFFDKPIVLVIFFGFRRKWRLAAGCTFFPLARLDARRRFPTVTVDLISLLRPCIISWLGCNCTKRKVSHVSAWRAAIRDHRRVTVNAILLPRWNCSCTYVHAGTTEPQLSRDWKNR